MPNATSVWKKGRYSLLLWSQNSKQSWQADICHLTYINHHQLINPASSLPQVICWHSVRVRFIQMESLSCWGWLLFDASICWGNNGNGAVKSIHCNTSKGKKCEMGQQFESRDALSRSIDIFPNVRVTKWLKVCLYISNYKPITNVYKKFQCTKKERE